MPSIITNSVRQINAEALAEKLTTKPSYVFIGKSTPWTDEELPPSLIESEKESIDTFDGLLAMKRVVSSNICSVVPRYDWQANTVYDFYDHRVNMVDGRKVSGQRYNFYVLTDEFNVYKCIGNNNGALSTFKPNSQQITPFQTPDGYIWKYMYTLRAGDVFSFLTPEWMPIYTLIRKDGSIQWNIQESAIPGAIHEILVDVGGTGYSTLTPPTVVISGSGTGATAVAQVSALTGAVEKIIVTNPGQNYTNATVSLVDTGAGLGASMTAILSPIYGHGKDPKLELGGYHKMVRVSLSGSESGDFPLGTFRQTGLIHKPLSIALGSKLTVNNTVGIVASSVITGTVSGATGIIQQVESDFGFIWVRNVVGEFVQNETITANGETSLIEDVVNNTNILATDATVPASEFVDGTGELLYISNRTFITRSEQQTEEVRMVLTF
jgi:hypothetical protein